LKADAEAQRAAAEAAEAALKLAPGDRQRLQVALTSLGFDTRGIDGALGVRSRQMIAEWQKARGQPATGFLTAPQQQALLTEGAPALQKYDEQIKKADEERKRLDAAARQPAASTGAQRPSRRENVEGVMCQDASGRRIAFSSATSCPYGLTAVR
jgi:peptidoglycan hydrolase-like protein with peptidoglycan-binding domain